MHQVGLVIKNIKFLSLPLDFIITWFVLVVPISGNVKYEVAIPNNLTLLAIWFIINYLMMIKQCLKEDN